MILLTCQFYKDIPSDFELSEVGGGELTTLLSIEGGNGHLMVIILNYCVVV